LCTAQKNGIKCNKGKTKEQWQDKGIASKKGDGEIERERERDVFVYIYISIYVYYIREERGIYMYIN